MKKSILYISFFVFAFTSCKKNLPDVGGTSAQKIANEWWVNLYVGNSRLTNYFKIATYNTANNTNQIWIDDFKSGYGFKVKATAVYDPSISFSTTDAPNEYYDSLHPANFPKTVTIKSGSVFIGKGVSKTGNVTDSIYMEAVFSDDPTTTYIMSGHARTRFTEDDY